MQEPEPIRQATTSLAGKFPLSRDPTDRVRREAPVPTQWGLAKVPRVMQWGEARAVRVRWAVPA